jgi:hypothetical protein
MLLTITRVNFHYPSSLSWFRIIWIFSKFWNFVKGIVCIGVSVSVFVKNSIFQKCPKLIIPHNNELLNKIYNISESGDVEFPIFGYIFIFMIFWKNEFFWKKSRVELVLEVSPMPLKTTRVNLQYPSGFSWFRVIWFFSKFLNFDKAKLYWRFCENLDF